MRSLKHAFIDILANKQQNYEYSEFSAQEKVLFDSHDVPQRVLGPLGNGWVLYRKFYSTLEDALLAQKEIKFNNKVRKILEE